MKLTIRYFASVREAIGTGVETLESSAATLAALRDELVARGGAYASSLGRGKALRVSCNQLMCDETFEIAEGDEVGFFPPVTGG